MAIGLGGGYIYFERQTEHLEDLRDEVLNAANTERMRDERWERDDVDAVAEQNETLQKLVLDHEHLITILERQTTLLEEINIETRESFHGQLETNFKLGLIVGQLAVHRDTLNGGY